MIKDLLFGITACWSSLPGKTNLPNVVFSIYFKEKLFNNELEDKKKNLSI